MIWYRNRQNVHRSNLREGLLFMSGHHNRVGFAIARCPIANRGVVKQPLVGAQCITVGHTGQIIPTWRAFAALLIPEMLSTQ